MSKNILSNLNNWFKASTFSLGITLIIVSIATLGVSSLLFLYMVNMILILSILFIVSTIIFGVTHVIKYFVKGSN